MSKAIGVVIDGETIWHVPGVAQDYSTLCGLDADDPGIGHTGTVEPRRGQKINCSTCYRIWRNIMEMHLREVNFEPQE